MGLAVGVGALCRCSMGTAPVPLVVEPEGAVVTTGGVPMATIMDFVPLVNIATFAVCHSPANPACDNPTGQAPCVPAIAGPWAPGATTVQVNGIPALTEDSVCVCTLGGEISIAEPGQVSTQLPD